MDAEPGQRADVLAASAMMDVRSDVIPTDELLAEAKSQIWAAYEDYTNTVSEKGMAIGLRSAAFIYVLCDTLKPARMVDFGSGFTSYVLRLFPGTVVSVDDSPEWLDKTRDFLARHDMPTDGLVLIDDFKPARFDFIVYDYAGGDTRDRKYGWVTDMLEDGGVIYYDDAHHDSHRAHMHSACAARQMNLFGLVEATKDDYGRYGAVGCR